jgi:hypothetical protein
MKLWIFCALNLFSFSLAFGESKNPDNSSHPRLYFIAQELPRLRSLRSERLHAKIYKNLIESADW